MRESVLIERPTSSGDDDLRATAVSDLAPASDDVPRVGTVLDQRYEITGLLGQGGMGYVLSARHVVLGQRIAIKVLRPEMTRDQEIVERFRREARAASAIGHAGIVQVKDFGSLPSGASYYVMEHVEGVGLADELQEDGPFSLERAIDVVVQMADALGAAHAAGIVHRDVKPDNVILTSFHGRPDHVKVLDFGIAKLDFASRLSGAHRVLGTPAYMSPEQARGQTLDRRCDVYALGVLFFELLTGEVPFEDPRPLEVLRQQIQVPAPSVQLLRPDVPDAIADVIARCLEKKPDARPESMAALAELLAPFVTPRSVAFGTSTASPAPPPVVRPPISVTLTPVLRSAPSRPVAEPAVSRPTPDVVVPRTSPRASRGVLALGVVFAVLGVAALAAAGGILARERSDDAAASSSMVLSAPPAATSEAPPPSVGVGAPPVQAPLVVPAVVPAPVIAAPPPALPVAPPRGVAHPMHAAPRAAPAAETEPPSAAPPPPPSRVEHPAIQLMDPWS